MDERQSLVATLKNIETLLELGSIRISDCTAANDIARIESNLLAWEIMHGETVADATERGARFVSWVKESIGG